ncbi:MAG: carboxypeptidase [Actinobacteria bacterium]|nr:carboxypeptidase [Actinomycetota bacterium]
MASQAGKVIAGRGIQGRGNRTIQVVVLALALVASLVPAGGALAQETNQVTALAAEQHHGFATLGWDPVAGATDYQIERTPVDGSDQPTGPSVITGLWRPDRQVNQESPTFADSGFNPGDRFQWRVRARFDGVPQPYSAPVFGTTLPPWGDPNVPGQNLRTQWEETQAAQFTNDVNEYAYTAAIDEASDRVRVVEIGRTVLNRPINMFVIGYPRPPATAEEVARSPSVLINCNVHGNEPSGREACLIMARELAFADDARTLDILSNTTVLIVPAINGDGRAANTRGNSTGQDLNRDYSLIRQPETFAFVKMMRDYQPQAAYDGHEFGNSRAGDLPMLPPRHLNVGQSIFDESQNMIVGWMYEQGSIDGWWPCPYGCTGGGNVGLSQETILRNTMGLKNVIGSLLEARSAGGVTRPDELNTQNNRRRKGYSQLWTYHQFLDYARANQPAIEQAIKEAIEFQTSNTGRIVFRGSRPIPAFPAPHPGQDPPPEENPSPDQILEDPPCGYLLSEEQYNGPRTDGATTVAQRIEAHGWSVHRRRGAQQGYLVSMFQSERGLIPLLLDAQAAEELVDAQRMYPPPGFPEGEPVPPGACGRGVPAPSAEGTGYDLDYVTD